MGKGLLGLNPMHSDKFLFSNVSLAGLLTVLYAATDHKTFIAGKYHYILYYLTLSIYPRMLITVSFSFLLNFYRSTKTWKQSTHKCVLDKRLTPSARPANPRKLQGSKHMTRPCSFSRESAPNSQPKNSYPKRPCWRTSQFCGRTPTTSQTTTT